MMYWLNFWIVSMAVNVLHNPVLVQGLTKGFLCWRVRNQDTNTCSELIGQYDDQTLCCKNGGKAATKLTSSILTFKYKFGLIPAPCVACTNVHLKCENQCECKQNKCSAKSTQVCGTDGKTYNDECVLKQEKCQKESLMLEIAYHGPCRENCKNVKCDQGKSCVYDQNGTSHCIFRKCPKSCQPDQFVCGSNGKTYRSKCHLSKDACELGRILVSYLGKCNENKTCKNVKCKKNHACVTNASGKPSCISCCHGEKSVPMKFLKICGTNGKLYSHWCDMWKESCRTGRMVKVDPTSRKCKSEKRHYLAW